MTTIKLSDKKSLTISPAHGQVSLHLVHGFLAFSERMAPGTARAIALALNAAADQVQPASTATRSGCVGHCEAGTEACPNPRLCGIAS